MTTPAVDYFEVTYLKGRIERISASYFQQATDFLNFKSEDGKLVYAVRVDAILSCETVMTEGERFVSNPR